MNSVPKLPFRRLCVKVVRHEARDLIATVSDDLAALFTKHAGPGGLGLIVCDSDICAVVYGSPHDIVRVCDAPDLFQRLMTLAKRNPSLSKLARQLKKAHGLRGTLVLDRMDAYANVEDPDWDEDEECAKPADTVKLIISRYRNLS